MTAPTTPPAAQPEPARPLPRPQELPVHELLRQHAEDPPPLPRETATLGDVVLIARALIVEAGHAIAARVRRQRRRHR